MRIWGCKAHVLIPKPLKDKWNSQTYKCRFIGYLDNGSGYKFYHKKMRLFESRDVTFIKEVKPISDLEKILMIDEHIRQGIEMKIDQNEYLLVKVLLFRFNQKDILWLVGGKGLENLLPYFKTITV